jgi:hypothetical protein
VSRSSLLRRGGLGDDNVVWQAIEERAANMLRLADARAAAVEWPAGKDCSAADVMMTFTLKTMRYFALCAMGALRRPARLRPSYRRPARLSEGPPAHRWV